MKILHRIYELHNEDTIEEEAKRYASFLLAQAMFGESYKEINNYLFRVTIEEPKLDDLSEIVYAMKRSDAQYVFRGEFISKEQAKMLAKKFFRKVIVYCFEIDKKDIGGDE